MNLSQKNILIVCHHYPPHITGVGRIAYNQAKYLASHGNTITVITSDTASNEKSKTEEGVNVVRVKALNFLEKFDAPFPIFSPKILFEIIKYVRMADVVHIHDGFYISSFIAAVVAKYYKKPIVLTQHVSWVMHPSKFVFMAEKIVYATAGAIVFRFSDKVLTYNDRVEKFLLDKGVPKHKLERLTNGVDLDVFHPAKISDKNALKLRFGLNPNKKTVLFVGRFVPKKGFDKVIASKSGEYQIVCVGGDALNVDSEEVIFLGKLSQREIADVYRASDIFVLPSESEGFPLSIQEAMACGLPIISASDEGYRSYNLDSKLFCMIDNPTAVSVKKTIGEILGNQTRLDEMTEYSIQYAGDNFNWPVSIKKLEKIYESVISNKNIIKKIAFISDAIYLYNKGGKEKRLYDISQRLVKNGYEVTIYCMNWWNGNTVLKKDGITYHAISPYYPLYHNERRSIKEAIFFSLNCFKLLNKSFDVIDVDHIPHLVLFTTKIVCLLKRKTMIVTWHEVWGKKYWRSYLGYFAGTIANFIEKIGSKLPDKIISVSDQTTRELREVLGVKKEIVTIPNGLDFEYIRKSEPSTQKSDIIFAGRLLENKNINILLQALQVLKKRGITMKTYIVGEGPEKNRLEKLSQTLGLQNDVNFLGFLENQSDLYSMIKSSKVFVLPSNREGFGIVVIEANACGLPVITVNGEYNAAKNLIVSGENGIVCDLSDVSLADAIEKELKTNENPEFYSKYSEKFDWNNVFPLVLSAYK